MTVAYVFASLELPIAYGTNEDVVLVVDGAATSRISVSLFERFERANLE